MQFRLGIFTIPTSFFLPPLFAYVGWSFNRLVVPPPGFRLGPKFPSPLNEFAFGFLRYISPLFQTSNTPIFFFAPKIFPVMPCFFPIGPPETPNLFSFRNRPVFMFSNFILPLRHFRLLMFWVGGASLFPEPPCPTPFRPQAFSTMKGFGRWVVHHHPTRQFTAPVSFFKNSPFPFPPKHKPPKPPMD